MANQLHALEQEKLSLAQKAQEAGATGEAAQGQDDASPEAAAKLADLQAKEAEVAAMREQMEQMRTAFNSEKQSLASKCVQRVGADKRCFSGVCLGCSGERNAGLCMCVWRMYVVVVVPPPPLV